MASFDYDAEVAFSAAAPGYWATRDVSPKDWKDYRWQLKNRVQSLARIEEDLTLSEEERSGILLTGTKLASAVTPHYFNLVEADNPACPIRRQIIPRLEETFEEPR